jgi:hypothetical protein
MDDALPRGQLSGTGFIDAIVEGSIRTMAMSR